MLSFLFSGILLGLGAGITPGPLNALILSESMKHGKRGGMTVAVSPLITDAPVVICSILFLKSFSNLSLAIALISILGGIYIFYLGYKDLTTKYKIDYKNVEYKSPLKKAVITNLLTPHPFLFWFTIGAPMFIKGNEAGGFSSYGFITGFYIALVGSKIILAILTGKIKTYINKGYFTKIIKGLGLLLILFSIILIVDGLKVIL